MKIRSLIIISLVVGILGPSGVCAQPCTLGLDVTYVPVQQLSLADIDLEHFESHSLLFTVTLANSSPLPVNAQLQGTLSITLASGVSFPTAVTFVTTPFEVPTGTKVVTNLDMGRRGTIQLADFEMDAGAKASVQDIALATGKFPAGLYVFRIEVKDCATAGHKDIVFDLRNPSRVELRSPRDGEVTNEFPLFEYYADGERVVLTVAEKDADQSRDDAIERRPPMVEVELVGQNSFFYAGGRPLQAGKSYVWRVQSRTRGTGGIDEVVNSQVGLFEVGSPTSMTLDDAILLQLERIFGASYPQIFEQIRSGQFSSTGNTVLNLQPQSRNEVLNLLEQLQQMSDEVELSLE